MSQIIRTQSWWTTPIVFAEHEGAASFNDRLAEIILEKESEIKRTKMPTPVAGVQSGLTAYWLTYNVLNWNHPECRTLASLIVDAYAAFVRLIGDPDDEDYRINGISCWANVVRHGESLEIHHHDPGFVSAHYTVKSGYSSPPRPGTESGHTIYYRPGFLERSQGDSAFGGPWDSDWKVSIPPTEGRLTLFPSYVRHEVRTHLGDRERISIALDIYVKKQRDAPFHFAPPRWFVPQRHIQVAAR